MAADYVSKEMINKAMQVDLLEYAKNMGVQRTLFISSSEVYGNRKANVSPYGEDDYSYVDLLNIRSWYSSS